MDTVFQTPADHEQRAAIEAMRARQASAAGPTVFFPFGKQQPLHKYVGMQVIPFQKNRFIDQPQLMLKDPIPGGHYGWPKKEDARVKGLIRSGKYVPVYLKEIKEDTEAEISVEEVMTENGPEKLVLWHGHMLVYIPPKAWFEEYEQPALMSAVRMSQHQQAFEDFSMQGVQRSTTIDERGVVTETDVSAGSFRDLRGHAKVSMTITP